MTQSVRKSHAYQAPGPAETLDMFARLDADLFLANQLFRHGLRLPQLALDGTLTAAGRKDRIRTLITERCLAERPVIRGSYAYPELSGKTLRVAFETLYREPLDSPQGDPP